MARQITYGSGEETWGHFDLSGLQQAEGLSLIQGSHRASVDTFTGDHPGDHFFRARVPMVYSSEAEMLEWRAHWEKTVRGFYDLSFDPRQAFDGMMAFRPHGLSYQPFNNRELLSLAGDFFCNEVSAKALPDLCAPIETLRKPGPIRVGFASPTLRSSSCAPWTLAWLKDLGDDFETYAINLGDSEDEVTTKIEAAADQYLFMPLKRRVPKDARVIKALDLDVLIFLDLGLSMRMQQLATLRLARVQCATWIGPETSGLPTIDYFLSGQTMEPEDGQDHHREKLITLSGVGTRFEGDFAPASSRTRADFGADSGLFIVSLQPAPKFDPQWDWLYKRINEETGQPIYFKEPHFPGLGRILKQRFTKAGIRANFLPYLSAPDYRALIREADILLDTPMFNGGMTTIDALSLDRAPVTLPGQFQRGIQCSAFLKAANASGMVARDGEDLIALVKDADRRADAVKELQTSSVFEDRAPSEGMAEFLRSVCH